MMTVAKGVVVVALVLGAARAHAQTAQCVVTEIVASSDKKGLDAGLLKKLKDHRWDRKPQRWSD